MLEANLDLDKFHGESDFLQALSDSFEHVVLFRFLTDLLIDSRVQVDKFDVLGNTEVDLLCCQVVRQIFFVLIAVLGGSKKDIRNYCIMLPILRQNFNNIGKTIDTSLELFAKLLVRCPL